MITTELHAVEQLGSSGPPPLDALGEDVAPRVVDDGRSLEAVALADERIDDVDLDQRPAADVLDGLG